MRSPSLIQESLSGKIEGEVYTDEISRNLWSTDASMYQVVPIAIVTPKSIQDVINVVKYCYANNLPIHPRGGGAGLIGASIGEGVVMDFTTHMNEMIELDLENNYFKVQPGRKLALIQQELANHNLFLPPDPASAEYCSIGGNIGTNAGGSHSAKYGLMADYTESLTVVLANGELITTQEYKLDDPNYLKITKSETLEGKIYREIEQIVRNNIELIDKSYPAVNYNIAGYELRGVIKEESINLTRLFVGSEGTLGTIIEIKMRVLPKPKHSMMLIAYFKNAINMGKATYEAVQMGSSAVEVLDYRLMEVLKTREEKLTADIPDDMEYMLGIEFDGDDIDKIENEINQLNSKLTQETELAFKSEIAKTDAQLLNYWTIRKLALPLLGQVNDKGRKIVPVIEDASVPPKHLPEYLEDMILVMENNGVPFAMYGHAGKGLVHIRPLIDLKKKENIEAMVTVSEASFTKAKSLNGTMSGEHGDGRVRSIYIRELYGDEMYNLLVRVKNVFDYKKILNPEIKITEDPITKNLRYDENYEYVEDHDKGLLLHFQNKEWENEIEMCNGCSRCTSLSNTVNMCPVYKSSKKETATPRAKANILRSVISGRIDKNVALSSPIMKELIFNCTTCQSCTIDCPAAVNIPKIALEFKAEIVEKDGQPTNEYLLGSVYTVGRILSPISFITNWFMNTRFSRWMSEKTVKITRHRKLPQFARKSFIKWYRKDYLRNRPPKLTESVRKVAYFVGCTANRTNPNIGKSLIKVLEANNIEVVVPDQKCSGLPMFSYGNVKRAKKYINYSIQRFMPYVEQGYDIIVTCSSCGLSLKEEWKDLLGTEETQRISDVTYHFSEYLLKLKKEGLLNENFKAVDLSVGYHTPCHLRVQNEAKYASTTLLEMVPEVKVKKINQGCCGICGSWGYKKDNYVASMEIGEGLFGELKSDEIQKGVTDCPTCTLQMEHGTDKETLHPVEILALSYGDLNDT
ncbi:MAG: Anaerobic glycerol-3-phosphate dehydrogenase subunit C [Candidatus Heimdallarchaeota archaeon LC_2]|nr:MAG: Anaerobic glycerol-3-phosphate dehydrogenase subunit C [Candidatus Heimdallarchaeota archaeon LC_2]